MEALTVNTRMPKGGVSRPVSMARMPRIANAMGSKPSDMATGANTGTDAACQAPRGYTVSTTAGANGSIGAAQTVAYNATSAAPVTGDIVMSGTPPVAYLFPYEAGGHEGIEAIVEIEVTEPA